MDTYGQQVYNTALSFVHNNEAAEDLAQDTFIEIYQSIHKFNERSALGTWIYRVTVNKCLDHIRYCKRSKRFAFFTSITGNVDDKYLYDTANYFHPGVANEQKENARLLYAAIDTLGDTQRTAFILCFIEELPQKEVAAIMDLNVKAVESLLQRAKAHLRKKLGNLLEDRRK